MHRCGNCIAIRLGSHESKANAVISGKVIISVKVGGTIVGGQQKIEVAIAIEVGIGKSAPDLRLIESAINFRGNITKTSFAIVEKHERGLGIPHVSANVAYRLVDVAIGCGKVKPA